MLSPASNFAEEFQQQINHYVQRAVASRGSVLDVLGTFILDEVHLISQEGRGHAFEILLSKLRIIQSIQIQRKLKPLRIMCLSGTLQPALLKDLCGWLNIPERYLTEMGCKHNLQYFIIKNDRTICPHVSDESRRPSILQAVDSHFSCAVSFLAFTSWKERRGCLIFCPTRNWCEKLACKLAAEIKTTVDAQNYLSSVNNRKLSSESKLNEVLEVGIAWHHSGLSLEDRHTIEDNFNHGKVCVICCTTTLALGVNLKVSRVIIRSVNKLTWTTFSQMAGRAGRTSDCLNEIYICVDSESDNRLALNMIDGVCQESERASQVRDIILCRFMLSLFAIKRMWQHEELYEMCLRFTLRGHQMAPQLASELDCCLVFILICKFVDTVISGFDVEWNRTLLRSPLYLCLFFIRDPADGIDEGLRRAFHEEFRRYNQLWAKNEHLGQGLMELAQKGELDLYLTPLGLGMIESGLPLEHLVEGLALIIRMSNIGIPLTDLSCLLGCCVNVDQLLSTPLPDLQSLPVNQSVIKLYDLKSEAGPVLSSKQFLNMIIHQRIGPREVCKAFNKRNHLRYFGLTILYEYFKADQTGGCSVDVPFSLVQQLLNNACIQAHSFARILKMINKPDLAILFHKIVKELKPKADAISNINQQSFKKLGSKVPVFRGIRGYHLYASGLQSCRKVREAVEDGSLVEHVRRLFPVNDIYQPQILNLVGQISSAVKDLSESNDSEEEDGLLEGNESDESSSSSESIVSLPSSEDSLDRLMVNDFSEDIW